MQYLNIRWSSFFSFFLANALLFFFASPFYISNCLFEQRMPCRKDLSEAVIGVATKHCLKQQFAAKHTIKPAERGTHRQMDKHTNSVQIDTHVATTLLNKNLRHMPDFSAQPGPAQCSTVQCFDSILKTTPFSK